jgi:hypothetical protein
MAARTAGERLKSAISDRCGHSSRSASLPPHRVNQGQRRLAFCQVIAHDAPSMAVLLLSPEHIVSDLKRRCPDGTRTLGRKNLLDLGWLASTAQLDLRRACCLGE